jgi:hypothetical protein
MSEQEELKMPEGAVMDVVEVEETAPAEEVAEEEAPQLDVEEEKAAKFGWRPEEEYDGDGEWVDAKTFNIRGDFIKTQKRQDRKIAELQKTITDLSEHNKNVLRDATDKALDQLRREKAEAVVNSDVDAVVKLEEKEREFVAKKEELDAPAPPVEYTEFLEEHDWYEENAEMRAYADTYGGGLRAQNPDMTAGEFFNKVAEETRIRFATQQETPAPKKTIPASGHESNNQVARAPKKKGYSYSDLTEEQKIVGTSFVKAGVFKTIDEYIAQAAAAGQIG